MAKDHTKKLPELAVEAGLCHNAYDKIGLNVPNEEGENHATVVYVPHRQVRGWES